MELCHNLVVELQLLQVKVVSDFDYCLQSLLSSHYCSQLLAPLTAAAMERCWREHAAFTLLLFRKESEEDPSYWTGLCMSSWKDVIILRSFEEQPIFCSRVKRLFLQTRSKALVKSKALVRSVSVMYSSRLCLQHLSFSCPRWRPHQLLIFQHWICIVLQCMHPKQVTEVCSGLCTRKLSQ